MTKLFFLFFLCLLCFRNLSAQTDSTRQSSNPSPAERIQDTTNPAPRPHLAPRRDSSSRHDSAARHTVRHDSAYRRRDSIRRDSISRDLVHRDSLRRDSAARAGFIRDTMARHDSLVAAARHDSLIAEAASLKKGPPMLSFWKAVLSANPSFN